MFPEKSCFYIDMGSFSAHLAENAYLTNYVISINVMISHTKEIWFETGTHPPFCQMS